MFITSYQPLSLPITPYPLGWKQNHFHFATLKVVLRIMCLSYFALGIENSFPDRITTMKFLSEVLPVALTGKVSNEGKKVVSC